MHQSGLCAERFEDADAHAEEIYDPCPKRRIASCSVSSSKAASELHRLGVCGHLQRARRADHFGASQRCFVALLRSRNRASLPRRACQSRGVAVRLSRRLRRLARADGGGIRCEMEGEGEESLDCDFVLAALGRKARTRDLGLEELGIETDAHGKIVLGENFATSIEGVYALGDATASPELTPIAIRQAEVLVSNLFGGGKDVFDARILPRAVFATPALASVGLSEEEARAGGGVRVYSSSFVPLRDSLREPSERETSERERVFVKLIERAEGIAGEGEVLGCHMVGSDAPEIIQALALGLRLRARKKDFDSVVALHPTNAEEFMTLREFRE